MDGFAFLIAVVSFVMALVALNRISKLQTANFKLSREIDKLKAAATAVMPREAATIQADQPPVTADVVAPATAAAEPTAAEAPAVEAAASNWIGSAPEGEAPAAPVAGAGPVRKPADMEQALAGRWFVWIGGVAIAIGGLLFVKYAYDNGLLSPLMQVVLGLAAGLVLILAGEWVRRASRTEDDSGPNYVPAALSAAGLAVVFAAVYAAYALYGLVEPNTAFIGLAATGVGGLLLSRVQGPFIAALGMLGSYVTPALIPASEPSASSFFPYLLIILLFSLLILRGRNWWWLGHAALLGVAVWSVLWMIGPFTVEDVEPVGLTAIAMGVLALVAPRGFAMLREAREGEADRRGPLSIAIIGLAMAAGLLVLLVLRTNHPQNGLWLLAGGLALMMIFAWRNREGQAFAPAAGLIMLGVLVSWRSAAFHAWTLDEQGLWSWSSSFGLETFRYRDWMLGAGAVFSLIGILGVLRRPATAAWGLLGGGAAFLFLLGAWGRIDFVFSPEQWAMLAAGAALVLLIATLIWSFRPERDGSGAGLLALGAAALSVMALDRMLDGIWLTLAIAGLAFLYALLSGLLKPRLMGPVTAALASLTALRLFLSRELWFDDRGLPWGEHWVIYGYGGPALLFLLGSKLLRRSGHERSAVALEGISLGLLIALAALEIRVWITGGITYENPQFLEMAAHVLTWGGAAYGLMHRQRLFSSTISRWASRLLLLMAGAGAVGLSLVALNPVLTGEPVPGGLVINALLLAYLLPVPLILLIARRLDTIGWGGAKPAAHGLALVLLFAYVTIETKRVFQGMMLEPESLSLAETYAYSAVWLGFALVLFVLGIRLANQPVRLAGLAVLALVVLKVFIGDMSNLEGLWRIGSFVGLGLCLVGIGWLYQHFVRGRASGAAAPA